MGELGTWADYGIVGMVVGALMITFIWWVKAARGDLNRVHGEFTDYLKETAAKQTEALVSVGNALQRSIEAASNHEDRAMKRHSQIMGALGRHDEPLD